MIDKETHNTLSIVTGEVIPVDETKEKYIGEDFLKSINPIEKEPTGITEAVEGVAEKICFNTEVEE